MTLLHLLLSRTEAACQILRRQCPASALRSTHRYPGQIHLKKFKAAAPKEVQIPSAGTFPTFERHLPVCRSERVPKSRSGRSSLGLARGTNASHDKATLKKKVVLLYMGHFLETGFLWTVRISSSSSLSLKSWSTSAHAANQFNLLAGPAA